MCHIAENYELTKGVIVKPPAELYFDNGKPKMLLKNDTDNWIIGNKTYKRGLYMIEKDGNLDKVNPDVADQRINNFCVL